MKPCSRRLSDRVCLMIPIWTRLAKGPTSLLSTTTMARMIFLPEGWSEKTPSELSHKMVHHIQNMAGLKFACPEEREKMAFEAQERWLALFGRTLQTEFGLDPFTLLVRTNCLY